MKRQRKTAGQRARFMLQWHDMHTTGVAAACNLPLPLLADKRNGAEARRLHSEGPLQVAAHLH